MGPSRCAAATSKASPSGTKSSASPRVSIPLIPKTSSLSHLLYESGTRSAWTAKEIRASGISASGHASRRWACCRQNARSVSTSEPQPQKPRPRTAIGGCIEVPSNSRATSAWARASRPTPHRSPTRSGITSGVIASAAVTDQPPITTTHATMPSASWATKKSSARYVSGRANGARSLDIG